MAEAMMTANDMECLEYITIHCGGQETSILTPYVKVVAPEAEIKYENPLKPMLKIHAAFAELFEVCAMLEQLFTGQAVVLESDEVFGIFERLMWYLKIKKYV